MVEKNIDHDDARNPSYTTYNIDTYSYSTYTVYVLFTIYNVLYIYIYIHQWHICIPVAAATWKKIFRLYVEAILFQFIIYFMCIYSMFGC